MEQQGSEVARLLKQIEAEYEAARRALYEVQAGTARHKFIDARQRRMGSLQEELAGLVGQQESLHLICETFEGAQLKRQNAEGKARYDDSTFPPADT